MIEGVSHITFIVRDLKRAAAFFTSIFDAEEIYSSGDKTFSLSREKFFSINGLWICVMEGVPRQERNYDHVAFAVIDEEFETYESRVRESGVEVLPSRPRLDEEGRSIYFYDFDNHLFEIHAGSLLKRLGRYGQ